MNEILLQSYLDVIVQRHKEIARDAEHRRLLAELPPHDGSRFSWFVRLPVGRALVAVGRFIAGQSVIDQTNQRDAGPSIKLAG